MVRKGIIFPFKKTFKSVPEVYISMAGPKSAIERSRDVARDCISEGKYHREEPQSHLAV